MNEFWDNRYLTNEFVYGINPNIFLKEQLSKLKPGKILFPAEGEGRNAVYAATRSWDVYAFDLSIQVCKKAMLLADNTNLSLKNMMLLLLLKSSILLHFFDSIALIFAHFHPLNRKSYHRQNNIFKTRGSASS